MLTACLKISRAKVVEEDDDADDGDTCRLVQVSSFHCTQLAHYMAQIVKKRSLRIPFFLW